MATNADSRPGASAPLGATVVRDGVNGADDARPTRVVRPEARSVVVLFAKLD